MFHQAVVFYPSVCKNDHKFETVAGPKSPLVSLSTKNKGDNYCPSAAIVSCIMQLWFMDNKDCMAISIAFSPRIADIFPRCPG